MKKKKKEIEEVVLNNYFTGIDFKLEVQPDCYAAIASAIGKDLVGKRDGENCHTGSFISNNTLKIIVLKYVRLLRRPGQERLVAVGAKILGRLIGRRECEVGSSRV